MSDPRAQGEKGQSCTGTLPRVSRKNSICEATMPPGALDQIRAKAAEGDTAAPKDYKTPLKLDIPKENPPVNPKYSAETPIVLNKLPIFEDSDTNH